MTRANRSMVLPAAVGPTSSTFSVGVHLVVCAPAWYGATNIRKAASRPIEHFMAIARLLRALFLIMRKIISSAGRRQKSTVRDDIVADPLLHFIKRTVDR